MGIRGTFKKAVSDTKAQLKRTESQLDNILDKIGNTGDSVAENTTKFFHPNEAKRRNEEEVQKRNDQALEEHEQEINAEAAELEAQHVADRKEIESAARLKLNEINRQETVFNKAKMAIDENNSDLSHWKELIHTLNASRDTLFVFKNSVEQGIVNSKMELTSQLKILNEIDSEIGRANAK